MRIRNLQRLAIAGALASALFAIVVVYATIRQVDRAVLRFNTAHQMTGAASAASTHLYSYLLDASADALAGWHREVALLHKHADALDPSYGSGMVIQDLRRDLLFLETVFVKLDEPMVLSGENKRDHLARISGALRAKSQSVNAVLVQFLDQEHRAVVIATRQLGGLVAILTLFILLSTIAYLRYLERRVIYPLASMLKAIERVASGALHGRIVWDADDELGDLARSFNRMSADLGRVQEALVRSVAEHARLQTRRRMLRRIQLQARLIETAHEAIIVRTFDGRIVQWNHGATLLYGFDAKEVLGQDLSRLLGAHTLAGAGTDSLRGHLLEHGSWRGELRLQRADGVARIVESEWVLLDIRTLPKEEEEEEEEQNLGHNLVLEIHHDITERVNAVESLKAQSAALSSANAELDAFTYSVAHDLRAPLRTMDGFSQALLDDYINLLDKKGQDYLNYVRGAARQMGALLEALMDLSRMTRTDLRLQPVDLSALARTVLARLQKSQPEREVDLVIQEGLVAQADPRLLEVALINLLGNAWKFTGMRTGARIEFSARGDDKPQVYFVRDNGVGFNPAYTKKLFGAFSRLHQIGQFEGTGVGLLITQRIIHRHGGRIWAEGAIDRGATFYFTIQEEVKT